MCLCSLLLGLLTRIAALCERLEFRGDPRLSATPNRACHATTRGAPAGSGLGSGPGPGPHPPSGYREAFSAFRFDQALSTLWDKLDDINRDVAVVRPWEGEGRLDRHHSRLRKWIRELQQVAYWLSPFAPTISRSVQAVVSVYPIRKPTAPFPRLKDSR